MKNKRGLIKITEHLYNENWEEISIIFKVFKPAHIEFRFWENGTWYFYGTCDLFEEVEEGAVIPEYLVMFTRNENGTHTYSFKKS